MLEATSEGPLRSRFRVTRDGAPVGHVEFRAVREAGAIDIGDERLTIRRDGAMGLWQLEQHTDGVGTQTIATAEKPSAWRSRVVLHLPGRPAWQVRRPSAWRTAYELTEADRAVGTIRRSGVWRQRVQAEIPDDVPVSQQLFTLWMVLLLFRRDDSAAASAAGSG
jgi:hypothetical protein